MPPQKPIAEKALLIALHNYGSDERECARSIEELKELAGNLGIETACAHIVKIRKNSPRLAMGKGRAQELALEAEKLGCDLIIFDDPLTPAQQRNWERLSGLPVADRHEVILDIFAERAHTKEAALQVELARLEYELPRLKRAWTHFSRQRGGGVTQRGEGETQLQLDRRLLRKRIHRLKEELAAVIKQRAVQRRKRERVPLPTAAIVGYTNAGKSSLLNRLTGANVLAQDKLFATLDPTTRRLSLPSGQPLLLTDTVGFVRRLPHRLVEAFKATLEETVVSDFLIHIVDCSSAEAATHAATTRSVLKELGADEKPILTVYNKVDLVDDSLVLAGLRADDPECVFISARTGEGFSQLLDALDQLTLASSPFDEVLIPHSHYGLVARLHQDGLVRSEEPRDDGVYLKIQRSPRWHEALKPYLTHFDKLRGQGSLPGFG